jgi:hypothetical protein
LGGDAGQEIRLHPLQLGVKKSKESNRKVQVPKADQTLVASSLEGYFEKHDDHTARIRLQQRIRIGRDESNDWNIDD